MQRKRKRVIINRQGEVIPPAASAKPDGLLIMRQQENKVAEFIRTFGANEYKWLRISVQLKTAI